MRVPAPVLLPLLRSQVQGEVLAATYLNPDREYSVTELARAAGASVNAVQREVSRLVESGFLRSRRVGTSRYVRAVTDSVISRPLADLLATTYGPLPVLTRALGELKGIERAIIHGSWAARHEGTPGPIPGDVDLIIVGDVDADALDLVIQDAEATLRREVNVTRIRPERWEASDDSFITTVLDRPSVELWLGDR